MSKVLIIGGGHAGANTAYALRKDGFDGKITIISDEGYLPYHRPPLSKDFLKQNVALKSSALNPPISMRSKIFLSILILESMPLI